MKKKDQQFIKKENHNLILNLIQHNDSVSRAMLARMTNMSPTSISRIVESLLDMELVKESYDYNTTGVGRKATILTPNPDSFITLGIELDEKCIKYGFFDFLGSEIAVVQSQKDINATPESVIDKIIKDTFHLMNEKQIDMDKVVEACVGLPGIVDNESGLVMKSAQLGWENVSLGELLKNRLGIPVFIDNELKLRAIAEDYFSESKHHTMVVIGFGYGVGSAVVNEGKIFRGSINSAGEIGHTVVDPNGKLCTCGNFGCLQTFIAEGFLVQEASEKSNVLDVIDIINASKGGDKWATNILERAFAYAGITVNNSVCLYNPDKVILTGSMLEKSPYIYERIIQASKNQIWPPLRDSLVIEKSKTGENGVIIGAGLMARRNYVNQLNYEKEHA